MSICLVHAHPDGVRSRVNRALLAAAQGLPGIAIRPLYELYPDYDIDVAAEQAALAAAQVLVLQHPIYWYSLPALAKLWLDSVFAPGWAYAGGRALAGKSLLWAVTTGSDARDYCAEGPHEHPFAAFTAPMRQTARFCGMHFLEPLVLAGADTIPPAELDAHAGAYRERLRSLLTESAAVPQEPRR